MIRFLYAVACYFFIEFIVRFKIMFYFMQHNCINNNIKKMKHSIYLSLAVLLIMGAACSKDDNGNGGKGSLTPPKITAADGRDAIRPENREVRYSTTGHMHIRFKVEDEDGINQARVDIHHVFDGHAHGRGTTSSDFEHLDYRKIYEAEGAKTLNIDDNFEDVYWEGSNSVIGNKNVLAGPYDFSIDASDVLGNQTSFADNSSYLATFWIERSYAPQITVSNEQNGEIDGSPGQQLSILGNIERNTADALSSDIAFVWVRLYEEDDHGHSGSGDDVYDEYWGNSQWRSMSGAGLPSTTNIDLANLLSGNKAITLPSGDHDYELLIWVEDVSGNITQRIYEVHAH
jgi:hypothetical protein